MELAILIAIVVALFIWGLVQTIDKSVAQTKLKKLEEKGELSPPDPEWRVRIGPARDMTETTYKSEYRRGGSYYGRRTRIDREVDLNERVLVRLQKADEEIIHIGLVEVNDEEFDDKLRELTKKAEERLTTLQAVTQEYP